jgi:mRNA interferase HicA
MKLRDLKRHLRGQACVLFREGAGHAVWLNPANRKIASVPRHREIKEVTARSICKQLDIPQP